VRAYTEAMLHGSSQSDSGMDLRDLLNDAGFKNRPKQPRDPNRTAIALRHLLKLLAEDREPVLKELVEAAMTFCSAESAGISLEETETGTFRWVAIAGAFARYLDGRVPRNYSPCGTCLDTGRPQLFRVTRPYYDYLGVVADPVTDGILIPWSNEYLKGTLWCVSHSSAEAFDFDDYEFLRGLADFASIILRNQARMRLLDDAETARSVADTRLKRIMDTDGVGLIIFDIETGAVVNANDGFLRIVGYTHEDVQSGCMTWQTLTPPEWMEVSEEQMRRFKKTGQIGPYEKEYFRKDGSRRWMLFAGRDLGDGTLGEYAIDITGLKQVEAALTQNHKSAALERQTDSIAQELSNPLETITNLLSSVRKDELLDGKTKQYLDQVEAELRRITHIARQSLEFNQQ
jgi:PAS domain S-box-containing protein